MENKPTFEQSITRLEEITDQLEKGKLSLEDMVKLYEDGIMLSKTCLKQLDEYESRMETLGEKDDEP